MKPVIIYPPTIDWNYLHQRPQQLMKALAHLGCISIFCNPNIHKQYSDTICYLNDNLVLANEASFTTIIEWARAAYPESPLIGYFTYPPQIEQVRKTNIDLIWFDSVDEPLGEFNSWFAYYAEAICYADVVTASARSLVKRASQYAKSRVELIPNGCDYEHFKAAQTHRYIDYTPFNLGKPVIGYIGAIAPWLDWPLINLMAHFLPAYEFVFIGSLLLQAGISITSSNMHYMGHKDYADLPQYMSNFDYCLIPFKLNEMTKGVNPIKFWEYLASGKPIISSPLPEIPLEYVITVSEDEFPGFIPENSLMGRTARIALAQDNSWTKRAGKVLNIILDKLAYG